MEYRIKEHFNKFYPQAKITETTTTTGFFGNNKETTTSDRWVYFCEWGNRPIKNYVYSHAQGSHQKDKVCRTLEEAKLFIKSLNKGVRYHKIEG